MDIVNLSNQQIITLALSIAYLVVLPAVVATAAIIGTRRRRDEMNQVVASNPASAPAGAPVGTSAAYPPRVAA